MKLHIAVKVLTKMLRLNACNTVEEREAMQLAIQALKRWRNGDSGYEIRE